MMLKGKINIMREKSMPILMQIGTAALMMMPYTAMAAPDAKGLLSNILSWTFAGVAVLGGIYGILGVIHYAAAYSEGDGPAKNKAMGQIAAGVMLVALSVIIGSSGTIATIVSLLGVS